MYKTIITVLLLLFVSSPSIAQEDVDLKKEALKRIDAVGERIDSAASKLGVAAEHMWEVLAKQHFFHGIFSIIGHLTSLIVLAIFLFCIRKYNITDRTGFPTGMGFVKIVAWIVMSGIFFKMTHDFPKNMTKIANPEYYAAMEVKDMIK